MLIEARVNKVDAGTMDDGMTWANCHVIDSKFSDVAEGTRLSVGVVTSKYKVQSHSVASELAQALKQKNIGAKEFKPVDLMLEVDVINKKDGQSLVVTGIKQAA